MIQIGIQLQSLMRIKMNKNVIGQISKNSIKVLEYEDNDYADKYFIQSGTVGFWATQKELEDLHCVLNYYLNINNFMNCEVIVDGQHVSIQ